MSNQESSRDAGLCLGGFLGLFLGGILGFAVCIRFLYQRIADKDGTVHAHQALLPFLGVMAGACVGAVAGVVLIRLLFAVFTIASPAPRQKGPKETGGE
jgi:hypothetical protein